MKTAIIHISYSQRVRIKVKACHTGMFFFNRNRRFAYIVGADSDIL